MLFIASSVFRWNITVSAHKPGNFFTHFDFLDQHDRVVRAASVQVGSTTYLIQPWQLEVYSRPMN
jgi:hypothetical protein